MDDVDRAGRLLPFDEGVVPATGLEGWVNEFSAGVGFIAHHGAW